MKRIITALVLAVVCFSALAQKTTTPVNDTAGVEKAEVTKTNQSEAIDPNTRYVADWEDEVSETTNPAANYQVETRNNERYESGLDFGISDRRESSFVIAALAVIFGFPVFIVFIAFYFRYKNKQAKYRMVEKALESGQPLPEKFIIENSEVGNVLNKGIKNIFTGLGLWIFLWTITGEFGIGAIGLLVLFTGFGQVVIHYINRKKHNNTVTNPEQVDLTEDKDTSNLE